VRTLRTVPRTHAWGYMPLWGLHREMAYMPAKNENENPTEALHDSLIAAGYTVTIRDGAVTYTPPEMKQTAGRKTTAKTTPAKQTAWEAKQAQWYNTKTARANMAAHKKAGNLPRYVDGKLYSFETARALKMVTKAGNPTKAFKAGDLDATKGTDVEGFVAPEGYMLVRKV